MSLITRSQGLPDFRYYTKEDLASTTAPSGASLIGVEDAGGYFVSTNIENVLQEIVGVILPGDYLRLDGTNVPTANYNWTTDLTTTGTITAANLSDMEDGTAQGQMAFWDAGTSEWVHTETSELIWDDVNKRLGIGINTPAYKLDVISGTDNIVANFESTDAEALITFHDNTTVTNRTAIGAIGTRMSMFAGGSERISILTGGNVGIGTITPGNKLDITTGVTTNSGIHLGENENEGGYFTSTVDSQIVMQGGAEFVNGNFIARATTSSGILTFNGDTYFYGDAALTDGNSFTPTTRMIIKGTNGNVGIGTSSPSEDLVINDDLGGMGGVNVVLGSTSGNVFYRAGQNNNNHLVFGWVYNATAVNAYANMGTNGWFNDIRIDAANILLQSQSSGNVGIGTTTPSTKLSVNEKSGMSPIGGICIKLTNKTGAVTVAGQLVQADTSTNDAVKLTGIDEEETIGVFLDSGIASNAEAWVVISGIADVAMQDNTTATRGNWVRSSVTEAGYADATNNTPPSPAAFSHFNEIGNCIETVNATGGGTHILARCVLHFN